MSRERPWTDNDLRFLSAWAGVFPLAKLAAGLNRAPAEVARQFGADLTPAAVARRLGCGVALVRQARAAVVAPRPIPDPPPSPPAEPQTRRGRPPAVSVAAQPGRPPAAFDPARAGAWRAESRASLRAARASSRGGRLSKAQARADAIAERAAAKRVVALPEPGLPREEYRHRRAAAKAIGVPPSTFALAFAAGRRVGGRRWAYARDLPPIERAPTELPAPPSPEAAAVATAEQAVRVLAARHEAGTVLGRVEVIAPGVVRAADDDAERAYRRQQEREAELAEQEPWRAVLARVRGSWC